MADGDRPIVLVPLATARKAARRAGVTLNLSADDIALAGKWKHGWIPLDAVASAVKAKRYHGGGGEGRTVKGKGRAGSAVEARREPSRGRTKGALPTRGRTFSDAGDTTVSRRERGLPTGGRKAAKANPVGAPLEHSEPKYVTPGAYHPGNPQPDLRSASMSTLQHERDHPFAHRRASARDEIRRRSTGPRREPHISAEPLKDGRHKLTDAKSGESVKAVHLASFHSQGHTITGVRGGQMHTRDDSGKAHVYDPATGRAATAPASLADHARAHSDASLRDLTSRFSKGTAEGRAVRAEIARRAKRDGATGGAQQVAQDRTRRVEAARGGPKLADLSEADLQGLISRYGEKSVQADAARAEMLRRSHGGLGTVAGHRVVANPARGRNDTSADRAGAEAAKYAEAAQRSADVRSGGGDRDPAYAKYPVPSLKRMAESQSGPASVKAAAELRARGYVRSGNALNGKWTKGGK